ncbi:MAG: hypothetical protein U0V18_13435 [Anaerolineales bacterium]
MSEINIPTEASKNYTVKFLVAGGYILFFCLVIYSAITFYFLTNTKIQSQPVNIIATNLPPINPTPEFSISQQANTDIILRDDFSDNKNKWAGVSYYDFVLEVKEGKLLLESTTEGEGVLARCEECSYLQEPHYVQADFELANPTNEGFGLVFALDRNGRLFYLFLINTESKEYFLYHSGSNGWSRLIQGGSNNIKSFPDTNTLGVYVNENKSEFYINGEFVDSYYQSGGKFHFGLSGFFVPISGMELSIDNLLISRTGK